MRQQDLLQSLESGYSDYTQEGLEGSPHKIIYEAIKEKNLMGTAEEMEKHTLNL